MSLTQKAWEQDDFWREVVHTLTGGKKLRPDHYLDALTAEDLSQLQLVLGCSGTFAELRKACPPRRGGKTDGELPTENMLSQIQEGIRRMYVVRELNVIQKIEENTQKRCGQLGLDPRMTNAVVQIVGEEAIAQKANRVVGKFALQAAGVLMKREGQVFTQARFNEEIELAKKQFALELEKHQFHFAELALSEALRKKADEINSSSLSNADKIAAMRKAFFADVDARQASGGVKIPKA